MFLPSTDSSVKVKLPILKRFVLSLFSKNSRLFSADGKSRKDGLLFIESQFYQKTLKNGKLWRMDFKKYLEITAKGIDDELDEVLSKFLNDVKKTNIKLLPFALGLLNSTRGGKRIRGVLIKLGFEISAGSGLEIIKVA